MAASFIEQVERRLQTVLRQQAATAPTKETKLLIKRLEQLILRAGKRSRPRLLELTYRAYGGTDMTLLIDLAVALEFQHQFLLVHDDIMDDDEVRYDGPNILGYYRHDFAEAPIIASSMALMAGNLLYTFANQAVLEHPTLSAPKKVAILALMQTTNVGVHVGQQLDIVNIKPLEPVTDPRRLLDIAYFKTALYSVRLPMQVAAELLELPASERQAIDEFARSFGILYQLTDDYADYFRTASSFETHPKYRDFRQGKLTYPLLVALQQASATDKAWLKRRWGHKHSTTAEMEKVIRLLTASGAQASSAQQIADYQVRSRAALNELKVQATARQEFEQILVSISI